MSKKRIGIFGGSFDPPHLGHALMASWLINCPNLLDEIWLLPTPHNPLKDHNPIATDQQRVDMLKLITEKIPGVYVSLFELSRKVGGEEIYTYDTLIQLSELYPDCEFSLIIGGDNKNLKGWKNAAELREKFEIICYPRDPRAEFRDREGLRHIVPYCNWSSTSIRSYRKQKKPITFLVPDEVEDYIILNKLYL